MKLDDTLPDDDLLPVEEHFDLVGDVPVSRPVDIGALAARYFRFSVGVDEQVQSVELDFSGLSGLEHLRVDALIDNVAGWLPEPAPVSLDGDPRPRFCFDLGPSTKTVRGAFAELRLVLSNASGARRGAGATRLTTR